jgi:hypothetical protein
MSDKEKETETTVPASENVIDNVLSNLFNSLDPTMLTGLTKMAENVINNTSQSNNIEKEEQCDEEEEEEELDLDLYLLDEEGNNICDHLTTLNNTLTKLHNTIEKFTTFYIDSSKSKVSVPSTTSGECRRMAFHSGMLDNNDNN